MTDRIWMDQGGTFTDVLRLGGRVRVHKVPSDRVDLAALCEGVPEVRLGTTVATNALLERRGVPVLLVTNRGFGDLPWIGDQTRPDLFALHVSRPPPLCVGVVEVDGRISASGEVLEPVRVEGLAEWVARGVRSAAVVLVHGPLAPDQERELGRACREAGFEHVSLGHEVAPSRGFLPRLYTTLADAALTPLLPRAPGLYMKSDGGLARVTAGDAREWRGAEAVLSGPVGGVVAVAALATRLGLPRAFGLDMGGTSTDVSRVEGRPAEPERVDHLDVAGVRLRVPAIRVETVAAGGGSVLCVRAGTYEVGPRSAGADPGPAAYGRGGPATLTDVEVVLGRLPRFPAVCGPDRDQPLDRDAARRAIAALDPNRPVEEVAMGFREVAAETMARAVRRLAAERGVDPAGHALVAFGGAGPAHACAVARRLGIRTVLVPRLAGAFSAVGIGLARRRAEAVAPVTGELGEALEAARARLPFAGVERARVAMRYRGTSELIEVPYTEDPSERNAAFVRAHRARFGFERPAPIEVVEVRVAVEEPAEAARLDLPEVEGTPETVTAWFGGWRPVPLLPLGGRRIEGPALLAGEGTTVVVEPGWVALPAGDHVRLEDHGGQASRVGTAFHPVHTAVFGTRIAAVAEQMGERLARLARSVSIRERRDFSCAVFDRHGRLVANAPHVPVHLGAMGETVRDLLHCRGGRLRPGQAWVSNDPYAGGSHLPDITVVMPVFRGELAAFVAARGHHVDVGGITPGSMPPAAHRIDEEGFLLRHELLAEDGRLCAVDVSASRQPDDVQADLEAQVAACSLGVAALHALADEMGDKVFLAQLGHLLARGRRAAEEVLGRIEGTHEAEETLDDGTPIRVRLEVGDGRARLAVQAPAHPGNLNAPRAVAVAVLLYVFRCLVDEPIPLNEGALEVFDLDLEPAGLFDPQPPRAVAGGNVETSQRLADALFRALGVLAASQGTMNNLTVGTPAGAWYETIGGGSGAGPGFDGADAVHVHMTNTRATDVEELEARFPVRIERWARRTGSGGAGRWRGGDGVIKQWRFLAPAEVSILAQRRRAGAPGLAGGGSGAPGLDERDRGQGWEPAPRHWRANPGDRLRISTPGGGGYGEP